MRWPPGWDVSVPRPRGQEMGCTEIQELLNEAACPAVVGADMLGVLVSSTPPASSCSAQCQRLLLATSPSKEGFGGSFAAEDKVSVLGGERKSAR